MVKKLPASAGDMDSIPGMGDSLEKGMATHSSILAWKISQTEGAWWATVRGVTKEANMTWRPNNSNVLKIHWNSKILNDI